MAINKTTDKLTDAEKKKVKQANKAKANPGKAEEKAKTNLKRRINRGQVTDPDTNTDKKKTEQPEGDEHVSTTPKLKQTDTEKAERKRLKLLAVEKEIQDKMKLAQKERFKNLLSNTNDDSLPPTTDVLTI